MGGPKVMLSATQYGIQPDPIFVSLLSIFLVALLYTVIRSRNNNLNLPPSPPKLPIIGNLHQVGTLPHRSFQSLARKYGPVMLLHFGQVPTLVVSSADAAKEVMKTQDLNFSSRPRVAFAEKLLYSNKGLAFSPYGEYWKEMRKISVLQLLSGQRVESFRTIREEEVNLMISKIREWCTSASSVVNLRETLFNFTNGVICRVTLGRKLGANEGAMKLITEFNNLIIKFNVADFIPWLSMVNNFNGLNVRVKKISKELDCFLESVIEEHIDPKKKTKNSEEAVKDFVDVLLGMKNDNTNRVPLARENVKAVILDIFVAGTDTLTATLIWAMTELIRHPEIMKEVQNEIREIAKGKLNITEDDLGQMHYLKMVIKEVLRLHSPAPLFLRESIQDTKLLGYDIPARTRVFINQWAIANDPMLWDDPEKFRPKRFLNTSIDYQGKDIQFIPFGAGRRGCPGISFAAPNMELPLANLLYHFDWSVPNGLTSKDIDLDEEFGLVCHKKSPLLLVPTPCGF